MLLTLSLVHCVIDTGDELVSTKKQCRSTNDNDDDDIEDNDELSVPFTSQQSKVKASPRRRRALSATDSNDAASSNPLVDGQSEDEDIEDWRGRNKIKSRPQKRRAMAETRKVVKGHCKNKDVSDNEESSIPRSTQRSRVRCTTTKWSQEELQLLLEQFGSFIRPPVFKYLRKVQQMMPSLQNQSLAQIKTRAWALVSKK